MPRPNIKYFVDCFFSVVEEIEHYKIIESTSRKGSKIKLCPNIRNVVIEIFYELRNMPTKDFQRNWFVKARCFEAINQSLLMLLGIINKIVNYEGFSCYTNDWIILRIELPVAVVVENIQKLNSWVSKLFPSL